MPTVSVKLPDETKSRLDRLAAAKGSSPHAFMVEAIEARVDAEEKHDAFVASALRSRERLKKTGKAYDGDEVIAYMRAKMRGEKAAKPRPKALKALLKKPA